MRKVYPKNVSFILIGKELKISLNECLYTDIKIEVLLSTKPS